MGISCQLFSQQLPLFSQYREYQTFINPASVGSNYLSYEQNISFGVSYRSQWQGIEGAPKTAILRGDYMNKQGSPVNLLAGAYLINDQTGPTGFTGLYGRVGGVLSDDPYFSGIAAGLSFGMVQYRVNSSEIRLRQPNDVLSVDDQTKIFPDVGLGVFAYKQFERGFFDGDYVYGGISVPQVMGLDLTFKDDDGEFSTRRVQHFYATAGYYKFFGKNGFLEPSVWLKYTPNAPVNIDFNLRYQMAQNFWVGGGGSTAGTMHAEVGFLLGENLNFENTLKIGYSFDYFYRSYGPYTGGSHEINITYSIDDSY
jgi:type IX secretion system PorP/SprF family membrane protein